MAEAGATFKLWDVFFGLNLSRRAAHSRADRNASGSTSIETL
jgi:hypothetical protein